MYTLYPALYRRLAKWLWIVRGGSLKMNKGLSITDTPDFRDFAEKSDAIYYMRIIPDLELQSTIFSRNLYVLLTCLDNI